MAYGDFENLTRTTASDKILRDEAFNIAKNLIKNWQKNYTNQLLENSRKEKQTQLLQTIFGVQMWQICN